MVGKAKVGTNSKGRRGLASSCRKKSSRGETLEPQGRALRKQETRLTVYPAGNLILILMRTGLERKQPALEMVDNSEQL